MAGFVESVLEMVVGAFPISVVIPLYNKAAHIQRAILSVLGQSVSGFEFVVVDDGSTDGGAQVVNTIHDPRIRLVHQENAGVSVARNRGIAEARTDLTAFLDADDEWLPDFLETVLRLYRRFPGCGAYATARDVVEEDGRRWTPVCRGVPAPPWEGIIPDYFRSPDSFPVWSSAVAVPRHVFDTVGFFPVGVPFGEDTDMWCRIALKYPIAYSSQPHAVYHKEAENRACARLIPREHPITKTLEAALRSGILPAGVPRDDIIEYKNRRHIHSAGTCINAGFASEARAHLRAAASTRRYRREWRYLYLRSLVPTSLLNSARRAKRFIRRNGCA